ncbi:aspartate kinase [Rubrolithibacter danxiaensis]|uniref:aspartate kinase n=1 Tax=Rubrolithibacter danxiaensis TaxID=3390805 RepID=UPI003BF81646
MTEVFKFGGASVKDAEGIKNLAQIVKLNSNKNLLIVVSAMGKTTNALEELTKSYINQDENVNEIFSAVKDYHFHILENLFAHNHKVFDEVANTFVEIDWIIEEEPAENHDFVYDQIVSLGELVSSKIVAAYLEQEGIQTRWLDARSYIHTDNTYREGQVDWDKTRSAIQKLNENISKSCCVTQGFIGGTSENYTTTLGREGSDYTAAIFASCFNAEAVTIWKDVPGVLNADPKLFNNTLKYEELSYTEALEMTYYGATVIHPKTIKPLKAANIPLYVKPFMFPEQKGTVVKNVTDSVIKTPAIIVKNEQVLISLTTKDSSFITENHLSDIFKVFAEMNIKINMIQNSAISFSACFDFNDLRFEKIQEQLKDYYNFKYNTGLKLLTVRHPKQNLIDELSEGKTILMEQISRNTAQLVIKD